MIIHMEEECRGGEVRYEGVSEYVWVDGRVRVRVRVRGER